MPYLYQFGSHRPGMFTIETSRSGTGILAALANMKLFGKQGLQVIIGHIVKMTRSCGSILKAMPARSS